MKQNNESLVRLRKELKAQLDFIFQVLEDDRISLQNYYEEFGDVFYRPKTAQGFGCPTEITLKPLIHSYKATIKSLLDSIHLLNNFLGGESNGDSSDYEYDDFQDVDDSFDAEEYLRRAKERKNL